MARLLACWEMGGGYGHVAQLASAARPLAVMGHESWLAARDVVRARGLADKPFDRVLQAPLWVRGAPKGPTFSHGQLYAATGFADDEALGELVQAWLSLFELAGAEAIYGSHAPVSLLAAHVARLPAARIGTPFSCPPARQDAGLMPWVRPATPAELAVADRVVRAVCRRFGAPILSGLSELFASARPFLTSWPELELGAARTDSEYLGPTTGLGGGAHPDWPDLPGPRLLVYLPMQAAAAAPLVAALAARGWPAIWVSEAGPAAPLPANIHHQVEPLALGPALAEAALFVTRGGHGSALDAIVAACPMLVLADTLETEHNARALAAHGLARRFPGLEQGWDAAAIGAALDAVVRPDAPERAAIAAAAARHAGHDPAASATRMARQMARALRLL
ncbi:MAG: hypothetical protein ACMVO5_09425 [Polymorphobacter sp.]|uniref:hypothetical protein n=1 Tax=Polymorphobacter sp. TaxID=1909290 RepID=UPI003A88472E